MCVRRILKNKSTEEKLPRRDGHVHYKSVKPERIKKSDVRCRGKKKDGVVIWRT
jgi:hypothetical protein